MSRSKKRNNDDLEDLKSENRELKSIIKSLERQIKNLNKQLKIEFDAEDLAVNTALSEKVNNKFNCPKCSKGSLKESKLGPRTLTTCSNCDYRKVNASSTKYKYAKKS